MYDIIGDIHGHGDELVQLLTALGYEHSQGHFQHPERKVIFVGDFVDRGPKIREVLEIVRGMHEHGAALAVMGNHEFNALAYHTVDPRRPDRHLRPHTEKNQHQHAATLVQLSHDEMQDYLEWFRQLPMWLELPGLRVVHACWDAEQMQVMQTALEQHGGVTSEFLSEATDTSTPLFAAIDDVLKGKEFNLPGDLYYHDKEGNRRRKMRIQWYRSPEDETFASYGFTSGAGLPPEPLPRELAETIRPYSAEDPPVLFGHYWMKAERPVPLAHNVACVDYSVAKEGLLVAYRWNGETELVEENFIWVEARRRTK